MSGPRRLVMLCVFAISQSQMTLFYPTSTKFVGAGIWLTWWVCCHDTQNCTAHPRCPNDIIMPCCCQLGDADAYPAVIYSARYQRSQLPEGSVHVFSEPELYRQNCSECGWKDRQQCAMHLCATSDLPCASRRSPGYPLCIPQEKICDGRKDCDDWMDERNCNSGMEPYRSLPTESEATADSEYYSRIRSRKYHPSGVLNNLTWLSWSSESKKTASLNISFPVSMVVKEVRLALVAQYPIVPNDNISISCPQGTIDVCQDKRPIRGNNYLRFVLQTESIVSELSIQFSAAQRKYWMISYVDFSFSCRIPTDVHDSIKDAAGTNCSGTIAVDAHCTVICRAGFTAVGAFSCTRNAIYGSLLSTFPACLADASSAMEVPYVSSRIVVEAKRLGMGKTVHIPSNFKNGLINLVGQKLNLPLPSISLRVILLHAKYTLPAKTAKTVSIEVDLHVRHADYLRFAKNALFQGFFVNHPRSLGCNIVRVSPPETVTWME